MQPINFIDPVPARKQRGIERWHISSCLLFILIIATIAIFQTMQLSYLQQLEKKHTAFNIK